MENLQGVMGLIKFVSSNDEIVVGVLEMLSTKRESLSK